MSLDPLLSILIGSVEERDYLLKDLLNNFDGQIEINNLKGVVETIVVVDNKQISIGLKRQILLEQAKGKFIVYFDDDDYPYPWYVETIVNAIRNNEGIDCIGMEIEMTTNGTNHQMCLHSLKNKEWRNGLCHEPFDYYRNITHFNPVLRTKALQAGFRDLRFGEDIDYSSRLNPLLEKEFHIDVPLFQYRYTTTIPHDKKYGFKK